jgi:hypothetical protein
MPALRLDTCPTLNLSGAHHLPLAHKNAAKGAAVCKSSSARILLKWKVTLDHISVLMAESSDQDPAHTRTSGVLDVQVCFIALASLGRFHMQQQLQFTLPPCLVQLLVAAVKDTSDPGHSVDQPATERCQEALQSLMAHCRHFLSTRDQEGGKKAATDFMNADGVGAVCAAMESYPAELRVQVRRGWIEPSQRRISCGHHDGCFSSLTCGSLQVEATHTETRPARD